MKIAFAQTGENDYCEHFLKSVEGNELWHITDMETPVLPGCNVHRVPRKDGEGFIIWRAKAYADFNQPGLYCDTDLIIQRNLDQLWALDFDVMLTRSEHRIIAQDGTCTSDLMPYNGGVAFVKNANYWPHILMKIQDMRIEAHDWWGDQLAMAAIINVYRTILLPAGLYNYSPKRDKSDKDVLGSKYILHFKGDRKPMMIDYAKEKEQ